MSLVTQESEPEQRFEPVLSCQENNVLTDVIWNSFLVILNCSSSKLIERHLCMMVIKFIEISLCYFSYLIHCLIIVICYTRRRRFLPYSEAVYYITVNSARFGPYEPGQCKFKEEILKRYRKSPVIETSTTPFWSTILFTRFPTV